MGEGQERRGSRGREGAGGAGGAGRESPAGLSQLRAHTNECMAEFRGEQFYQQHFTEQVILITAGAGWAGNSKKKQFYLKKSSRLFENTAHTPYQELVGAARMFRLDYRDWRHGPSTVAAGRTTPTPPARRECPVHSY